MYEPRPMGTCEDYPLPTSLELSMAAARAEDRSFEGRSRCILCPRVELKTAMIPAWDDKDQPAWMCGYCYGG